MKLIRGYKPFQKPINTVVTIGNFDGLHLGHQKLITALKKSSEQLNLPSVLLTFEPHPQAFFSKNNMLSRIMSFKEKWIILLKYRIDYLYCLRFNKKLADLSAEDFVETILVKTLGAKEIIVGDDFKFGAKRAGDVTVLKKMGEKFKFQVIILPQENKSNNRISSSRIREALNIGDFKAFYALTGRPFYLSGKIIQGEQLGRQLGFPTANILLNPEKKFLSGIFVVRVSGINHKIINGVASIGYRPTFDFQDKKLLLEVYLFDFNQDIYGKNISVELLKKIRDEENFESVEQLIEQIKKDIDIAKTYLSRS